MTSGRRFGLFGVTLVVAAVCIGLGFWQGSRLKERRARNTLALARAELPPVDLNASRPADLAHRRATARGSFDHDRAFILRGRVEREAPGVQIVTPLLLDGGDTAVLVNRGFVPAADAMTPPPEAINRVERARVVGLLAEVPVSPDTGSRLERQGQVSWRRLDLVAARSTLPYPVLDHYLHVTDPEDRPPGGPPFPVPAALRPLDDGPHLAYMIQWFGIAAAAVAFGVMFVLRGREIDRRRP